MITLPTTTGDVFLNGPEDVISSEALADDRTLVRVQGEVNIVVLLPLHEVEAALGEA